MEHVRHRWQSRIIVKSKTIFAYSMWLDSHRVCFCMRVNENQTLLTASKNEQNKMGDRFIFASSFVSFRFDSFPFISSCRVFYAIHAKNVHEFVFAFFICYFHRVYFSFALSVFFHLFPVCCWFHEDVIAYVTLCFNIDHSDNTTLYFQSLANKLS